jgi:hypothetical protein
MSSINGKENSNQKTPKAVQGFAFRKTMTGYITNIHGKLVLFKPVGASVSDPLT